LNEKQKHKSKEKTEESTNVVKKQWRHMGPEIWPLLYIKKECIFGPCGEGQVKCSHYIISKEEDPSVANEKQVREDELCSLFMPVGYCYQL